MEVLQGLATEKHYNLTHYQQRYNWDCGISCILMILSSTQRQDFLKNFNNICEDEGFGASTWTIDLCYILKKFKIRHEYFTKTLGVDPNYSQHSYYTKIIDKDEKRIEKKFNEAKTHGLYVEQRTVEMLVLLKHLAKHGPLILLTNASLLTCEVCKQNVLDKVGCFTFLINNKCITKSYAGHYVVLCGYNLRNKKIFYHNPEVHDEHVCYCSVESMDIARKAYGTDEDIIFIYNN